MYYIGDKSIGKDCSRVVKKQIIAHSRPMMLKHIAARFVNENITRYYDSTIKSLPEDIYELIDPFQNLTIEIYN
jgi:acyl-CoA hydrolase